MIRDALEKTRTIEVDGEKRRLKENQILIMILIEAAHNGKLNMYDRLRAIQMLWDRGYGKPTEDINMSGELSGGGVIIVERANRVPDKPT